MFMDAVKMSNTFTRINLAINESAFLSYKLICGFYGF